MLTTESEVLMMIFLLYVRRGVNQGAKILSELFACLSRWTYLPYYILHSGYIPEEVKLILLAYNRNHPYQQMTISCVKNLKVQPLPRFLILSNGWIPIFVKIIKTNFIFSSFLRINHKMLFSTWNHDFFQLYQFIILCM